MFDICPDYPCSEEKYSRCMEENGHCFQGYCENEANRIIENLPIFINKYGQKMIICKCKPLRTLGSVVTEREYLNDFSKFEPCSYRCKEVMRGWKLFIGRKHEKAKTREKIQRSFRLFYQGKIS